MKNDGAQAEHWAAQYLIRQGMKLIAQNYRGRFGEIDLIMPLTPDAKFDGFGEGWLVYVPGTAHYPTVSSGRALVLYLLPGGAIEFTQ